MGCYIQLSNVAWLMKAHEFVLKWPHSETAYVSIYQLIKSYWMYPIPIQSASSLFLVLPDLYLTPAGKGRESDSTVCYHGIRPFVSSQLLGSHVPHKIPNDVFIILSILFLWNFSSRLKCTSLSENRCISEGSSGGSVGTSCRHTATSCGKFSTRVIINNLWNF